MDSLRKPFLVLALVLIAIAVIIEIGGGLVLPAIQPRPSAAEIAGQLPTEVRDEFTQADPNQINQLASEKPPASPSPTWRSWMGSCCSRWPSWAFL